MMKISAFVTAIAMLAGVAGPSLAFDRSAPTSSLVHQVGCSPNDDDKQGKCMQVCDDTWIKASQAYSGGADAIQAAKDAKKACDGKCGC
jgi:hypothetical protein